MEELKEKLESLQKYASKIRGEISIQRWMDMLLLVLYMVVVCSGVWVIQDQDKRMDYIEEQLDSMAKINGCIRLADNEIVQKYFD